MQDATDRWFFSADPIAAGAGEARLSSEEANHATRVLRLSAGDLITLFDGAGGVATAVLPEADRAPRKPSKQPRGATAEGLRVELRDERRVDPPAAPLTLIVAACKGPRLEWLVEKCTELGVAELCFARFTRSVVAPGGGSLDKLRRIAIESCKQCHRAWLPRITQADSIAGAIESRRNLRLFVAHPQPGAPFFGAAIANAADPRRGAAILIGPEGGITNEEVNFATGRDGVIVRLADHILRVETAAVACAAAWAAHGE
ncbi:MAG: 16S rRNA (uracil(1498)-N(3))-methyltransferase [Phycisphaerae bacterium]|nr:16S rRNA (uracil(1498)-N(3))-methyltransferase [Phycisphaerae bacterium]